MYNIMTAKLRALVLSWCSPEEKLSVPAISLESLNGFGGQKTLRSMLPAGSSSYHAKGIEILRDVQVLTRFHAIESPYWLSFVSHYHSIGVQKFYVCVQSQYDYEALSSLPTPKQIQVQAIFLPPDLNPNQAIRHLDASLLKSDAKYTLWVDCDEYFWPMRPGLAMESLFKIYPDATQFCLPWIMSPLPQLNSSHGYGYWGHIGKSISISKQIETIVSSHSFKTHPLDAAHHNQALPIGLYGMSIVHYWARSLRDCLLKTFQNKFEDTKSCDSNRVRFLISIGELPIRMRLLAFLDLQSRYIPLQSAPIVSVDLHMENAFMREYLPLEVESQCFECFHDYRSLLDRHLSKIPIYPATSLLELAKALPSMHEIQEMS